MKTTIFAASVIVSLIASVGIIYWGFQQDMDNRAEWFQLAVSVLAIPPAFAAIMIYREELSNLIASPKIKIGLLHYLPEKSGFPLCQNR